MRTSILSVAFTAFLLPALAQNTAGLSFGTSISTISGYSNSQPKLKSGFTAVAHYQHGFKRLIFQGALDFTQKGYREKVTYMDANANILGDGHVNYTFNYVGLSLKAGVQYGDVLFGNTTIGITPSYLVRGEYSAKGYKPDGTGSGQHVKLDNMSTFDLSLGLETTVGYKFGEKSAVFLTAGANMGLWEIDPSASQVAASLKNHYVSLRAGYQFYL